MAFDYNYTPIIKGIGFCPNPVAKYGIPAYADSLANPKVVGTKAYESWWEEQFYRLEHGHESGSIKITPNFYWYLNFCQIATPVRGYHLPDYVDLDKEYFDLYQHVKENNRGMISLKKRRAGLSEKAAKGILGYGMYMHAEAYRAGLCAGLKDYSDDMRRKFRELNTFLPPELRMQFKISDTAELIVAGWKDDNSDPAGSQNTLYCRTMFNNANVFKGKFLNDVIYEEGGEFKHLLKGYAATTAGLKVGIKLIGTPLVYGTSGKSGSKDFRTMWGDANAYGLDRFFVPGYRLVVGFFTGSVDETNEVNHDTPNIEILQEEKNLTDEQVLGCEDVEQADLKILTQRTVLKEASNLEAYIEHFLDFPRTEAEALMAVATNQFDRDALANQQAYLMMQAKPLYAPYVLDDRKEEDGRICSPREIILRDPIEGKDRPEDIVLIRKGYEVPLTTKGYKHAYSGGVDSYDQDQSITSKSLGAMVVTLRKGHPYRNANNESLADKRIPVMLIRNRPRRKEKFYDNCLKASIYWGLTGMTMIDAGKPAIIEYYKANGGKIYLAPRPLSFEAEDSTQRHDYGMMLSSGKKSKPQMLSVLQTWVLDEIDECIFPLIVDGLANYNEIEDDSDWDEVDALGLSIVCDIDRKLLKLSSGKQKDSVETHWSYNSITGNFEMKTSVKKANDDVDKSSQGDLFSQLINSGQI
jgi:hypothetical protein